jgi:hypothetical protein
MKYGYEPPVIDVRKLNKQIYKNIRLQKFKNNKVLTFFISKEKYWHRVYCYHSTYRVESLPRPTLHSKYQTLSRYTLKYKFINALTKYALPYFGAHPASCAMATGSFPGVKSDRGVTLTPHPF